MISNIFISFDTLSNIKEQFANPAGIRRLGVVAVADISSKVIDWPRATGATPDVTFGKIRSALPIRTGKTMAVIMPADNSAFMSFEQQGDRFYQSYKHSIGFDIAGLTLAQSTELRKYLNAGAIFFVESNDGTIRVIGSKLAPIVLKAKGDSGKKGGDKRGYSISGDNDNYLIEPPFYPENLPLPGFIPEKLGGFTYGFSEAFTS